LVVLMGAAGVLLSLSANAEPATRATRTGTDMREVTA
jgi:cell division protein FtsW